MGAAQRGRRSEVGGETRIEITRREYRVSPNSAECSAPCSSVQLRIKELLAAAAAFDEAAAAGTAEIVAGFGARVFFFWLPV